MKIFPDTQRTFSIAAEELASFYQKITGRKAEITAVLPSQGDAVCICPVGHSLADPRVKENSDEFAIVSKKESDRTLLVITAGRKRADLQRIYCYAFARAAKGRLHRDLQSLSVPLFRK